MPFKEWLIAKERVNRRNRNALQYAAGLTALLGIGGATTGVFALASSVAKTGTRAPGRYEPYALGAGIVLAVILAMLILKSLAGRRRAEREADEQLRRLPDDLFWSRGVFDAVDTL
jgi:hypothetical protein